jgi:hypothetical protein
MRLKFFISSNYKNLRQERQEVIDAIMDANNEYEAMENFVIGYNDFQDIEEKIDSCNAVILLLGADYGSRDSETNKSWTWREFKYAEESNKSICAIKLPAYQSLAAKDKDSLTDDDRDQIAFVESLPFTIEVDEKYSIYRIVCEFFKTAEKKVIANWKKNNQQYNLAGTWYSIHTSQFDKTYVRIGEVVIKQKFNNMNFRELDVSAHNYGVSIENGKLLEDENGNLLYDRTKPTTWYADYEIYPNKDRIIGVYVASRFFDSTFENELDQRANDTKGIHEFDLRGCLDNTTPSRISGTFRNAADTNPRVERDLRNTHKAGSIVLFNNKRERDKEIKDYMKKEGLINEV